MKVVLLIPKLNAGAQLAMNRVVQQIVDQEDMDVVGVIQSDNSIWSKRYWKYLFKGVKRWGIFYAFFVGVFFNLHFVMLFLLGLMWWRKKKRKWLSTEQLAEQYGFKVHDTQDINSDQTLAQIREMAPDVMVSLYFDQILKKAVIDLPKMTTLNMHPGPLPSYKGLWPCFWQLYNRDKKAMVTVHQINEKVDEGEIFGLQRFAIDAEETKFSLLLKTAQHGAGLVVDVLKKLKKGVHLKPLHLKGREKYYTLPKKRHLQRYFADRKRLFWLPSAFYQVDDLS